MKLPHAAQDNLSFVICQADTLFVLAMQANTQLRKLNKSDAGAIEMHLLALDPVSRNRRFLSGFSDIAIARYVLGLDFASDIFFGAVESDSGEVVGLAEAHSIHPTGTVEIGASVLDPHRRRGLARELVALIVAEAAAHGANRVELLFDPGNYPAARIAAGLNARFCSPGRAVLRVGG
jgi:GNAT superfamily N-acetyltransferase